MGWCSGGIGVTMFSSEIDAGGSSECLVGEWKVLSVSPGSMAGAKYPRMGRLGTCRTKEHKCPQVRS